MSKVVICTPTRAKPTPGYLKSLAESVPILDAAGWDHAAVFEVGSPYISHARSKALRKALDAGADAIIFIDDDLAWEPDALLKLLSAYGNVVAGTYRFKKADEVEYMGAVVTDDIGLPVLREDGCIEAHSLPAGFLRITREGVNCFMKAWPELLYGEACAPHVDLFNHGAHAGVWWGEDYAFTRRWREKCGKAWILPDLTLTHWDGVAAYPGNFHKYLLAQPGGSEDPRKAA